LACSAFSPAISPALVVRSGPALCAAQVFLIATLVAALVFVLWLAWLVSAHATLLLGPLVALASGFLLLLTALVLLLLVLLVALLVHPKVSCVPATLPTKRFEAMPVPGLRGTT
jgi:hypothetical protein